MSKTGNPITQAINRGIQKVDTSTPCETASEINKSQRETLKEKPDRIRGRTQELKDGSVLEGCGVTNATAIFSDTFSITSTSNYTAQTFDVINRVAEGNKPKNRPDGSPLACQEEPHQYAGNDSNYSKTCNGGHAEARILDTLVLNTDQFGGLEGKSLIFNIDWRSGPQGEKKIPCRNCFKMMCYALDCGIKISLCENDFNETLVDVAEFCNKEFGYEQLMWRFE